MNILITGAAGFIGSHLSEYFLSKNHTVIGLDNFDPFYDVAIKKQNISDSIKSKHFNFYEGSILDIKFLESIFNENKIDLVIHLASKAGVRPSIHNPQEYFNVNVNGTLNLLETMKKAELKKMIFASSSSIYGNNPKVPFSEKDNVDYPISPYAASKKSAELICHTYHHLYAFDIFCLRFFTVYGSRQRPDLAIHKFTKAILNKDEITIYGDGTTQRDYTHISDIVDGISKSIDKLSGYEIINLGESYSISLAYLVALLEQYTGTKAKIRRLPMQPGDVEKTYADISKAKSLLDYKPKIKFENGIKDFIEWYKSIN